MKRTYKMKEEKLNSLAGDYVLKVTLCQIPALDRNITSVKNLSNDHGQYILANNMTAGSFDYYAQRNGSKILVKPLSDKAGEFLM